MVEKTVTIGEIEVQIEETEDGFEVEEVEDDAEQPDFVADEVWAKAMEYSVDPSDVEAWETGANVVFVKDGDDDIWLQVNGELFRPHGEGNPRRDYIHDHEMPDL